MPAIRNLIPSIPGWTWRRASRATAKPGAVSARLNALPTWQWHGREPAR